MNREWTRMNANTCVALGDLCSRTYRVDWPEVIGVYCPLHLVPRLLDIPGTVNDAQDFQSLVFKLEE